MNSLMIHVILDVSSDRSRVMEMKMTHGISSSKFEELPIN